MTQSFKQNVLRLLSGSGIQVLSQILSIVVLARLLTPVEFGVVSASILVVQFLQIFAEYGLPPYVVQLKDLNQKTLVGIYTFSQLNSILWAAALILSSRPIAYLLNIDELRYVIPIYSISYLLLGLGSIHDAIHQRNLNYKIISKADSYSYFFGYAGMSILCAWLGFSFWSIVIGHLSQALIRCVMIRQKIVMPQQYFLPQLIEIRPAISFGFWQSMSRLASFSASQIDSYIVAQKLGAENIGIYGRSNQLATMPVLQLGQVLDRLIFPYTAKKNREYVGGGDQYIRIFSIVCYLSFPIALLLSLSAKYFVPILLGHQWVMAIDPVGILLLAMPFRLIHKISDPTARAYGATSERAWRQWIVTLTLAITAYVSVSNDLGLTGVAYCVVAASMIDAMLMTLLCLKITKRSLKHVIFPFICGFSSSLVIYIAILLFTNSFKNAAAF